MNITRFFSYTFQLNYTACFVHFIQYFVFILNDLWSNIWAALRWSDSFLNETTHNLQNVVFGSLRFEQQASSSDQRPGDDWLQVQAQDALPAPARHGPVWVHTERGNVLSCSTLQAASQTYCCFYVVGVAVAITVHFVWKVKKIYTFFFGSAELHLLIRSNFIQTL